MSKSPNRSVAQSNGQGKPSKGGAPKVELIDPRKLKPSAYSHSIYGEVPDEEFSSLVEKNGITTPLECHPDLTTISGNRRLAEALRQKIALVPVIIRHDLADADELTIQKATIIANAYRKKSQKVAELEVAELLKIEKGLAKVRRNSKLKQGKRARPTDSAERGAENAGEAAAIVAKQVGRSADTVRKIGQVHEEIERLRAEGNEKEAVALQKMLDTKSVNAAHKVVRKKRVQSRSKSSRPGKKGVKDKADQAKQLRFLHSRVKSYANVGQKERSAQLKEETDRAVKGGRARDLVPLGALYRRERKLERPTPFDQTIGDIKPQLECLKSCVELIGKVEAHVTGVIDVENSKKGAAILVKRFTAALQALEKKADEYREERSSKGKPAPAK